MNKKMMVFALMAALLGGGIAGAALLPSAQADSSKAAVAPQSQNDNDKEVADDPQGQEDNDKEVADDPQGQVDNDKEVADDPQGQDDNDKEVADDAALTVKITKEQSIEIAKKQNPGEVQSAQLETENGVTAYNVIIKDANGKEQEINVDADSGVIIPEND